jgi:hypothetical protein
MTNSKTLATDGSTAVGGDNNAPITNIAAEDGATVNIHLEQAIARQLPSYLGTVIAIFSEQSLSEYARGPRRELPPEVSEKIQYNNVPNDNLVLRDFLRHGFVLEKCYKGVEQQNADARFLVRRRAGFTYGAMLASACAAEGISNDKRHDYITANASKLINSVIDRLLAEYKAVRESVVHEETAHLAISLIVADAIVECEVLERPAHASAS